MSRKGTPEGEDRALGHTIRVWRAERDLSRRELAEAAGVSYPFLSEIESGRKRPSTRTLGNIAEALGARTHELLADAEARSDASSLGEDAVVSDRDESLVSSSMAMEPPGEHLRRRPAAPRSASPAWRELAELLERLSREDIQRILDLARRLAR